VNRKRSFEDLLGLQVKALFLDSGKTKVITGVLREVNENYIIVNDVVIGLGPSFISCIPQGGKYEQF